MYESYGLCQNCKTQIYGASYEGVKDNLVLISMLFVPGIHINKYIQSYCQPQDLNLCNFQY